MTYKIPASDHGWWYDATTETTCCEYPAGAHETTRSLMTTPTREFTPARKAQGFRSQAHLDAFYAYYDHTKTCPACGQPAPGMYTADGGYQPAESICPEGRRLMDLF